MSAMIGLVSPEVEHLVLRAGNAAGDAQPVSLDGDTWILADARIDAREELAAQLALTGADRARLGDAQLILHAYRAWGTSCAERLLGDFAFAIWDSHARRLFCARDRFGVKAFFHAWIGDVFAFSNSLAALRSIPGIGEALDDLAIAEFLMFDWRQDPASTSFRDIRRLPPAHTMEVTARTVRMRRYWALPDELPVVERREADYVERFREVLRRAVADRVTDRKVSVTMSGGLDSPTIAATAVSLGADVRGFCGVYDHLIPDEERRYAGIAAAGLGIPIEFIEGDRYGLYDEAEGLERYFPEPGNEPCAAFVVEIARRAATHARVVLTGWDGDALLGESPRPYLRHLVSKQRYRHAFSIAARYAIAERKLLPASWRRRAAGSAPAGEFPAWLNPSLAQALQLHERWREFHERPRLVHASRPYAAHVLGFISQRSDFFDEYSPHCTGAAAEFRHPFLDPRVVELCLSLPTFPWCHRKEMLRRATAGVLPDEVRLRPKTPLAGAPYMKRLAEPRSRWLERFIASPALERYVDGAKLVSPRAVQDPQLAWMLMRPIALGQWLASLRPQTVQCKEHRHEYA